SCIRDGGNHDWNVRLFPHSRDNRLTACRLCPANGETLQPPPPNRGFSCLVVTGNGFILGQFWPHYCKQAFCSERLKSVHIYCVAVRKWFYRPNLLTLGILCGATMSLYGIKYHRLSAMPFAAYLPQETAIVTLQ